MAESSPFLPGLGDLEPAATAMEVAARKQLERLAADGMIDESHAIVVQLVLDLARAVGLSTNKGRAAGAALAARQLMDALDRLPSGKTGFDRLMEQLADMDKTA